MNFSKMYRGLSMEASSILISICIPLFDFIAEDIWMGALPLPWPPPAWVLGGVGRIMLPIGVGWPGAMLPWALRAVLIGVGCWLLLLEPCCATWGCIPAASLYGLLTCWPAAIGSSRGAVSIPTPSSACRARPVSPLAGVLTSKRTSISRAMIVVSVSVITLLKRFSSHSLAKLLGTAITTTLSSKASIDVFLSHVW